MNAKLLGPVCLFWFATPLAAMTLVGGDAIGPDSTLTDHLGGFAAVQDGADNFGQPAMMFTQDGLSLLRQLRVVVHGSAAPGSGDLRFDQFQYVAHLWNAADYLADAEPTIDVLLPAPLGVVLDDDAASITAPMDVFGDAAFEEDDYVPSYDFRFDLGEAALRGDGSDAFATPLAAGEWVLAFQSEHSLSDGTLLVSFSSSLAGNTPYYHRAFNNAEQHPRGVLLHQQEITFRWGMNLLERSLYADYDDSGAVAGADFLRWQRGDSPRPDSAGDLATWQQQFGAGPLGASSVRLVPEPSAAWIVAIVAGLVWLRIRRRGARLGTHG